MDNKWIITPSIDSYFSVYNYYYTPKNLFINTNYYYCSKSNSNNEYLKFDFKKEYWFKKIVIKFYTKYPENRIKYFNILIYDQKNRIIETFQRLYSNMDSESFSYTLNYKFRYIKFELLNNHGGNYYIIKNIEFIPENIYSIK